MPIKQTTIPHLCQQAADIMVEGEGEQTCIAINGVGTGKLMFGDALALTLLARTIQQHVRETNVPRPEHVVKITDDKTGKNYTLFGDDASMNHFRKRMSEHKAMVERLEEQEEVIDDEHSLRWSASGEPVARKGLDEATDEE